MLTLSAGESSLVVVPESGGAVVGWMVGNTPILRRAHPMAAVGGNAHAMGCFPLLPYANRIAHGMFRWLGADYRLQLNFGDHPHAIHGVGWQRSWHVDRAGGSSATLSLSHRPDGSWPFGFDASVTYALDEGGLSVAMRLTNRHDQPAPAGLGIHPYFPKVSDAALRFDALGAWRNGPDALPAEHGEPAPGWRHETPRLVAMSRLDNCFTGWTGPVDVIAGPASLRIEASEVFGNLQVFTPSWADFFCAEPVTHVPDAINRPELPAGQAMDVLAPGESIEGVIRLGLAA